MTKMKIQSRCWLVVLVAISSISTSRADDGPIATPLHDLPAVLKASKWGDKPVSEHPDALLLKTYEGAPSMDRTRESSALLRELVRQAFLLSGREMLGLATRDQTLREPIFDVAASQANAPGQMSGSLQIVSTPTALLPAVDGLNITVFRESTDGPTVVWERHLAFDCTASTVIQEFTSQLEVLSRTDFVDVLKTAGYSGTGNKFVESGPVPQDVIASSTDWNMLAQYFAIRTLHEAIRDQGESPERLAALAESYARLGSLTNYQMSPAADAFHARALLYAQRLVSLTNDSVLARRTRAYVFAFVGLHAATKGDLNEIMSRDVRLTDDLSVLYTFCEFKNQRLEEFAEAPELRPLVRFLQFLAIEPITDESIVVPVARSLVSEQPDCFTAIDLLAHVGSLGGTAQAASQAHQTLFESVTRRLQEREDLPEEVNVLVERGIPPSDDAVVSLDQQQRFVNLVALLRSAGMIESDRVEPSLACLGQLIFESGFANAGNSIRISKYSYALPLPYIAEQVDALRLMIAGHPLADGLISYGRSTSENEKQIPEFMNHLDSSEMVRSMNRMASHLAQAYPPAWNPIMVPAVDHLGPIYRDLSYQILGGKSWKGESAAWMLTPISPHAPTAALGSVRYYWKGQASHEEATRFETQFADNGLVLNELGQRYLEDKDWPAAERLLKKVVALEHSSTAFQNLAKLYETQEDWEKWIETMTGSLEVLGSDPLGDARIRDRIANYYMDRGEYEKALPYAEEAGDSGATWAMESVYRCYEQLGELKQSEMWVKQLSQRYDGSAFEWYLWCRRNATGDLDGARDRADQRLSSLGNSPASRHSMVQIAIYKFLRGDYKESLAGFADAYKRDQDPYDGLHAALIAAQLDDFDMQNQMLLAIIREGDAAEKAKARPGHVQLANLIVVGLLKRNSERPLDIEQADKIILDASARESNNLNYVVGKWLWLHGQEDDALKYLKTAAQSTRFNRNYSRYLAAAFLHDEGVDFSEGRNSD